MKFELPKLSYELDALEPYISKETMEYHYGKHHQTYVTNLNNLIVGTEFENMSLEEIIKKAPAGPIFNNAAQVWNHTFYFTTLNSPKIMMEKAGVGNLYTQENKGKDWTAPKGGTKLVNLMAKKWPHHDDFKKEFSDMALKNFGSGWTWLVLNTAGELEIINTSNAGTPLTTENKPLLTCDIWEHAYYIDCRNVRAKYIENFWSLVDWRLVEERV
nr:Fe-Mn family superoxide dismutase [Candidatus Gracilibacteria bacterium]